MFIIMKLVFWLVIFASNTSGYRRYYSRKNFTIGGLFGDDNSDVELAFKYTAQWYDLYSDESATYNTAIYKVFENNIFSTSKVVCNMTRTNKIIAVFGPETLRTSAITQSICKKLHIPHIQVSWQPSSTYLPSTSLNFYPDASLLAKGFATILKHMNWRSYAIIYQHDEALVRLQGILKIPSSSDNPVIVKQLEPDSDHRPMFKSLKNSRVSNIVLDCNTDDILEILKQAKEVKLLNYPTSYLLTSLDAHTLDYSILDTTANITVVRLFDPANEDLEKNIQSWEINEMRGAYTTKHRWKNVRSEAVLMIDAVHLFIESINNLNKNETIEPKSMTCQAHETWSYGEKIAAYLKKQRLENSLTGPVAFDQFGRRTNFTLQIFELNSKLVKATWSPSDGDRLSITITAEERKQLVLQSLQTQQIVVSTKIVQPYFMLRDKADSNDQSESEYEGYAVDLIDLISKELNFTYKFHLNTKNGIYDENLRKWTGVIGDVFYGEAQLGICDLTVTHQRRQAVDFSNYFMTLGISILYKKPTVGQANMFAFIDPLSEDVWMYTATAYLGVSILLYLAARLAPSDWENPNPCDEDPEELENIWNLGNALWVNMGSLMTLGCDIMPKGVSSRMIVAMWWFFSLLLTSSYTANMSAYLSKERMGPKISSVDDLISQSKIKFGTLMNGTTYEFFKKSNYSKYQTVWNKMNSFKPSTFVNDNEEGVRKVLSKNQNYAFFMESSSLEFEVNKYCELEEIGNWLDSKGYGIAMPLDAPYRGEINNAILQFQERGTLQALETKWWKDKNTGNACGEEDMDGTPNDGSLKLANVGGVFLVLGIGVVISFFIALIEFLWNVRSISVEENITYWNALVIELKFTVNIWVTRKATKAEAKRVSRSREVSEARSVAERMIHNASSFLHLDTILEKVSHQKNNSRQS